MFRIGFLSGFALLAAHSAMAYVPEAPSLKPARTIATNTVNAPEADITAQALRAAERSQWSELASLQARASDPVVRDLILWIRASNGVPGMGFDEISAAIKKLSTWPKVDAMRTRAEALIDTSALDYKDRIDWLELNGARSGAGKVALANAWLGIDEPEKATMIIRDAWHNHSLEAALERDVRSRFGRWLTEADHRKRADFLMWTNQRSAADDLKPLVSADYRKVIDARNALAGHAKKVDTIVEAVPASLSNDPGLLYERARYRRKRDNQEGASALLDGIDGKNLPAAARARLWDERSLAAREDLKNANWTRAYQLAAPHGMTSGEDFAEAEWMAGWIALRLRKDPARGLKHFETLANGVSAPISSARANYWMGRAHESLGDKAPSQRAFGDAAAYRFTYYGQLAAERVGNRRVSFALAGKPTPNQRIDFEARPMVRAMRLLGAAGETSMYRDFSYHLDDQLSTEVEFLMLAEMANEYRLEDVGVRGGKAGLAKGIVAPEAVYPVINYPLLRQPGVERSLMLALTRQESEMNPRAVSSVGARGLMQLMPLTAKSEAKRIGVAYELAKLRDDPGYNMTLGAGYLDTLLGQFNGSYIMTAAAYNAGPSRPRRWIEDYGDPRTGAVDPVDWVEFIPFSETRNYVMRVLENTQVYRHRLSGREEDIRLSEDLKRGGR
jgi:soluble lytic murein transglycosylase